MAKNDLTVHGPQTSFPVRIGASATRYEVGEPAHSLATLSSGVANVNVYVLAAADTPVIGTHQFGGVFQTQCLPIDTGTVVAHKAQVARPFAYAGRIRGKGETAADIDTDSEAIGIILDVTLIDYNATGAADGGELYTIKTTVTAADTSGLQIMDVNVAKGTVDVSIDGRAYRHDVS